MPTGEGEMQVPSHPEVAIEEVVSGAMGGVPGGPLEQ